MEVNSRRDNWDYSPRLPGCLCLVGVSRAKLKNLRGAMLFPLVI